MKHATDVLGMLYEIAYVASVTGTSKTLARPLIIFLVSTDVCRAKKSPAGTGSPHGAMG